MKVFIDKNYGTDADGNRGITMVECEIEESDREEIKWQITKALVDYDEDDIPETVLITLSDDNGEYEQDFEVTVCDYL